MPSRPAGSSQTWGPPDPRQKMNSFTQTEKTLLTLKQLPAAVVSQAFVWMTGYVYNLPITPPPSPNAKVHSHRHRHRSGWCGGAVAVHGTYRRHPGDLANSPHHYDQAPPWPALGACTPHAQILTENIREYV